MFEKRNNKADTGYRAGIRCQCAITRSLSEFMRPFVIKPIKLEDCRDHGLGSNAELFIVEGDSAAGAVTVLRNAGFQAALPMQGKPLNALRASPAKVQGNQLYQRLSESLGLPLMDFNALRDVEAEAQGEIQGQARHQLPQAYDYLRSLRFERVLMLFDPDADGIHIGALMLMFFYRWMRPLLESGHIEMVRAPLFSLAWNEPGATSLTKAFAYSVSHSLAIQAELKSRGIMLADLHHFRGLGSIDQALLNETCVDPMTRKTQTMYLEDAHSAIAIFGTKVARRKICDLPRSIPRQIS
jgi:DNA gyrase subunit B